MANLWFKCQLNIFCGANFSRLMTLNEYIPDLSRNHVDGNHVGVFNSIKMFSMATLMTGVNVQTLKHEMLMKG